MRDATGPPGLAQPALVSGSVVVALIASAMGGSLCVVAVSATWIFSRPRANEVGLAWAALLAGVVAVGMAEFVGVMGLVRQRRLAAEWQRAAAEAGSARTLFVTNMSHELRTPLSGILGYADLLAGDLELSDDRTGRRQWVSGIQRNGQHLLSVITDLLDLSRIEAGRLDLAQARTAPAAIIEDVLSMLRVRAHEKGLLLTSCIDDAAPGVILTDPLHLRQILLTLVGNAIKFTEKGGVDIRLSKAPGSPRTLRFEVRDTGIGIAPEAISQLFRPFTQADSSASRRYGGMGLGLSISRKLAELLGGDIAIQSEPGKGSVFTLTITPSIPPPEVQHPTTASAADELSPTSVGAPSSESAPPLTGVRILVAEDGRENQYLITHHLNRAGATVTIAENGRLAIEATCSAVPPKFDLILMDMQMPEMDGYTATRVLRGRGYTLPIIALTAHAMTGDREKCLAAGCSDYATKPIDKAVLIAVCSRAIKGVRSGLKGPFAGA